MKWAKDPVAGWLVDENLVVVVDLDVAVWDGRQVEAQAHLQLVRGHDREVVPLLVRQRVVVVELHAVDVVGALSLNRNEFEPAQLLDEVWQELAQDVEVVQVVDVEVATLLAQDDVGVGRKMRGPWLLLVAKECEPFIPAEGEWDCLDHLDIFLQQGNCVMSGVQQVNCAAHACHHGVLFGECGQCVMGARRGYLLLCGATQKGGCMGAGSTRRSWCLPAGRRAHRRAHR